MTPSNRSVRQIAAFVFGLLLAVVSVTSVAAHSDLETANPADGAIVPGPFQGPILLTFSAALGAGSKADLLDPGGGEIASAVVDGPAAKMTITLESPLGPAVYEVRWVSVAEDGDLLRGTVSFTVAPAAPTAEPTPSPSPTPVATASASASPSPTPDSTAAGGDVVLPIIVALVVAVAGGAYLLSRRGRPAA